MIPIGEGREHDKPPAILAVDARASFCLGGISLAPDRLDAQEPWPTRTITLVVPFPPGGTADFAGRPLAAHLADKLGQNVVVENKGGAGGGIGHAYVARAEPDGYTIMIALPSLAVIPEGNRLQGKPPGYEMDQFVPLARMFADPPILAVKKLLAVEVIAGLHRGGARQPGPDTLWHVRAPGHRPSGDGDVSQRRAAQDDPRAVSGRRARRSTRSSRTRCRWCPPSS